LVGRVQIIEGVPGLRPAADAKARPPGRNEVELLAPAGSFESLAAAIGAGADSVYFGVGKLDMRSGSGNSFGLADLGEIRSRSADAGVKAYMTLNTVVFDDEIPEMHRIVDAAIDAGMDAIVAADPAVMLYASGRGMPVHLSTQANVANADSLAMYSRFADVVVLARELDLVRVAAIRDSILARDIRGPSGDLLRLEMFAHGALCMAVSGKCYLSLHQYGKSANRGECLQSCRRSYILKDAANGREIAVEDERLMSPKDLKTIGFLDRILGSGVRILKIEGRARSPEYVAATVSCYREAVASILDGSYAPERIAEWDGRLAEVFNRGFWDGYYLGQALGEWSGSYGSRATRVKVHLGTCLNYYAKAEAAELVVEAGALGQGDEILFIGPTTGVFAMTVDEIRVDGIRTASAGKGDVCSVPTRAKVRAGDKVYRRTVP
jgi:putative protease